MESTKEIEKKEHQEKHSFFNDMKEFIAPYKVSYALSVIVSMLGVLSNLISYVLIGKIAGELINGEKEFNAVMKYLILLCVFKVLYGVLRNISTWISHHAAFKTLKDIRDALSEKMMKLPLGYFEKNGSGRLKNLMIDRIEGIEKTLAHMLPEMSANLAMPLLMIVWAFFIDWRIALCIVLWLIIAMCFSGGAMVGYQEKFSNYTNAEKNMNQSIVEYVGGIEVIKNFNHTSASYKKLSDAVNRHTDSMLGWMKQMQIYSGFILAVAPYSVFPVAALGLFLVNNNSLNPVNLFILILLSMAIIGPLNQAMMYTDQITSMGLVGAEIRSILDYKELDRGNGLIPRDSEIEFSDVSFSYNEDADKALDGVSFKIPNGSMFALVGASGSGKSTIAKLLAGYWDKTSGNILINGKDICEYSIEELNRFIAYVDQDIFLYNTSIMENIRIGNPKATDEEVKEAARKCGCDEFINALPDGYNTQAGVAGGRLSGGERQRIAIVRAMLKNAPVMILDEATSSSDPENETYIQQALSAASKGKTLIVVAHRLATIKDAQQIAVMENGKIEAIGTHDELLANSSRYALMYKLTENITEEV